MLPHMYRLTAAPGPGFPSRGIKESAYRSAAQLVAPQIQRARFRLLRSIGVKLSVLSIIITSALVLLSVAPEWFMLMFAAGLLYVLFPVIRRDSDTAYHVENIIDQLKDLGIRWPSYMCSLAPFITIRILDSVITHHLNLPLISGSLADYLLEITHERMINPEYPLRLRLVHFDSSHQGGAALYWECEDERISAFEIDLLPYIDADELPENPVERKAYITGCAQSVKTDLDLLLSMIERELVIEGEDPVLPHDKPMIAQIEYL
jgi:hypothetical protein